MSGYLALRASRAVAYLFLEEVGTLRLADGYCGGGAFERALAEARRLNLELDETWSLTPLGERLVERKEARIETA